MQEIMAMQWLTAIFVPVTLKWTSREFSMDSERQQMIWTYLGANDSGAGKQKRSRRPPLWLELRLLIANNAFIRDSWAEARATLIGIQTLQTETTKSDRKMSFSQQLMNRTKIIHCLRMLSTADCYWSPATEVVAESMRLVPGTRPHSKSPWTPAVEMVAAAMAPLPVYSVRRPSRICRRAPGRCLHYPPVRQQKAVLVVDYLWSAIPVVRLALWCICMKTIGNYASSNPYLFDTGQEWIWHRLEEN